MYLVFLSFHADYILIHFRKDHDYIQDRWEIVPLSGSLQEWIVSSIPATVCQHCTLKPDAQLASFWVGKTTRERALLFFVEAILWEIFTGAA